MREAFETAVVAHEIAIGFIGEVFEAGAGAGCGRDITG